jgi:hypothetical protein
MFAARNGIFMEKEILHKGVSGSKVQLEEIQETPKNVSALTDPIQEVQDVVPPDVVYVYKGTSSNRKVHTPNHRAA